MQLAQNCETVLVTTVSSFTAVSSYNTLLLQQQEVYPYPFLRIPLGPQRGLPSSAVVIGGTFMVEVGDHINFLFTAGLMKWRHLSTVSIELAVLFLRSRYNL